MTDRPSARMKQRLNIWLSLPVSAILIYTVATIFSVSIKDGKKWQSLANAQQLKSTAVSASRGTVIKCQVMYLCHCGKTPLTIHGQARYLHIPNFTQISLSP